MIEAKQDCGLGVGNDSRMLNRAADPGASVSVIALVATLALLASGAVKVHSR